MDTGLLSGFPQAHNIGNNANIGIRALLRENKKNSSDKMLPPVGIEPGHLINLSFQVNHSPFWANWAFACKTETKSENQEIHEQKFKDPLSSTWPLSSEWRVLDMESEVHERPRFYPHWG